MHPGAVVKVDVILVARHPFGGAPPLADWHLARALVARDDVRVLYVEPPTRTTRPQRARVVRRAAALWTLTPAVPPGASRPGVAAIVDRVYDAQVARVVRRLFGERAALLTLDPRRSVVPGIPRRRLVYWRRDQFSTDDRAVDADVVRGRDRRLMVEADAVCVPASSMVDEAESHNRTVVHIPNGVDVERFAGVGPAPRDADPHAPPVVGFVGGALERLDLSLLRELVVRRPAWRFEFVGGERPDELPPAPNLVFQPYVPYPDIPDVIARFDVGIVPYDVDMAFNAGSFPLKALEYLASGRPVVATTMPALAHLHPYVRRAATVEDMTGAIEQALVAGPSPADCRAVAAGHSWRSRADELVPVLAG